NNVTTLAADHTGSISYTDTDSLSVGSVTDTAMSMSVSATGSARGGSDLEPTRTAALSPYSIEAPVSLGAGDMTLKINGDVSQTSAGVITAVGLQILPSFPTRRSSDLNNVTTLAADHTGSISYTDADSLSVGSVTDTAMSMSV